MTPVDYPKIYSAEIRNRQPIFASSEYSALEENRVQTYNPLIKINLLKEKYNFNDEDISRYLLNNTNILNSLLVANEKIKEIFTNITELSLELYEDYEEDVEQLFIVIKSTNEPEELVVMLRKLDDEWFLQLPYEIMSKFNITVKAA